MHFSASSLIFALTTTTATLAAVAATPDIHTLLNCGDARYYPSKYTCFNGKSLCPINDNVVFQLCEGDGGCYDPAKYHCNNGHLGPMNP